MTLPFDSAEMLKDAVRIEPLALEEEYIRMPADLAYWNERYTEAVEAYLRAKLNEEKVEAFLTIDPKFQDAIEDAAGKKLTVDQRKAHVLNHPDFQAAAEDRIAAEVEKTRAKGRVDAIITKREMLVSLGAHIRIEMKGDPIVRERQAGRHLLDNE